MVAARTWEDVVDLGETHVGGVPLVGVEDLSILLLAMFAGFVAIWHMIVPVRILCHRMVAAVPLRVVH